MPAIEFAAHEPVNGGEVLCAGWFGVLTGDFPWFANPLYFAALLFALAGTVREKERRMGRIISQSLCGLALAIGMLSLRVREWWFDESKSTRVQGLGIAFYYWMGSFLVLLLLLFFARKQNSSLEEPANE